MFNRNDTLQNTALNSYPPTTDVNGLLIDSKCPVCSNNEFEWGYLSYYAYYVPGKFSMWRSSPRNRQLIKVRRCVRCNNLLQFTDAEASRQSSRSTMVIVAFAVGIAVIGAAFALFAGFAASSH